MGRFQSTKNLWLQHNKDYIQVLLRTALKLSHN